MVALEINKPFEFINLRLVMRDNERLSLLGKEIRKEAGIEVNFEI